MPHHNHSHGHDHSVHPPHADPSGRLFAFGVGLNLGFVALEAGWGWYVGSLALLADAGHNLSDVAGLLLGWAGAAAARLRPTPRHTYGWRKAGIFAAWVNALLLLAAMVWLAWEALRRLQQPLPNIEAQALSITGIATLGIAINTATALLFWRGSGHDLNLRGAFLHMAADALVSAGVAIGGLLTWWQGWAWIDPAISLVIVMVIVIGTWGLLTESMRLLFDAAPQHIDVLAIRKCLLEQPGVTEVQDLHVWALSTQETALTARLIMPSGGGDEFLATTTQVLQRQFGIQHITLQIQRQRSDFSACDSPYNKPHR